VIIILVDVAGMCKWEWNFRHRLNASDLLIFIGVLVASRRLCPTRSSESEG
jgi:hypothetical protein